MVHKGIEPSESHYLDSSQVPEHLSSYMVSDRRLEIYL